MNTAIVEKNWDVSSRDFKLDPEMFDYALVRPCNASYKTYRNFNLGKYSKNKTIMHGGAIASWHRDWHRDSHSAHGEPQTFEEMLVKVSLDPAVPLDFECWQFHYDSKSYIVKVIDLRTGEVLYDSVVNWLNSQLMAHLV